jgi:hypothetical protein
MIQLNVPPFAMPLFVTVGTSALTNDRVGIVPPKTSNETLRGQIDEYLADSTKVKGHPDSYKNLMEALYDAHHKLWSQPANFLSGKGPASRRIHRATSAELWSTYKIALARPDLKLDGIVLLASDTTEGNFAARLNQSVMKSPEYQAKLNWGRLPVALETVEGLDAEVNNPQVALKTLIDHHHKSKKKVRLNITGGYKGLAAHIGELTFTNHYNYFYLHESLLEPFFVRDGNVDSTGGDW